MRKLATEKGAVPRFPSVDLHKKLTLRSGLISMVLIPLNIAPQQALRDSNLGNDSLR